MERTFERIKGRVEPYWVCLPMATRTALSSYEMYWYPWDDTRRDAWVREMPQKEYVVNLENNPISTYRYRMHQEDLAKQFGRWYRISHGGRKTVCLLGIRADESLQRYSGFLNKKFGYKGECWISKQFKDVWCASPLYDWSTSDIWHANYRFGYDYNRLYDLYYMAGLKPSQMRVASPFNDYSRIRSTCTASSTPRSGQSWWGAYRARILPRSTATPRRWATGTSRFPRGTHGNPTPSSCWTHCPPACATITSKIQNVHPVLARNGRRAGRSRHP